MLHRMAFLLLSFSLPTSLSADDWPEWLGPNRQSVWQEDGIVQRFPTEGLEVKWRVPVGFGYSGPAVANNRVYITDYVMTSGEVSNNPGGRDELTGQERVLCFSANTGKVLWKHTYTRPYALSYPKGPRCVPTVVDGKVYTLGAEGDLFCLHAESGKVIWSKQLQTEYHTPSPIWGFCAHPLVVGETLYCLVGGEGSVAVAFNKDTGEERWRALSASTAGYCPPTWLQYDGVEQLLIWHPESLNRLDPETGKVIWSVPLKPSYEMSIAIPRVAGDLLFASGIGNVGALFQMQAGHQAPEVVWRGTPKTAIYSSNSTPFLENDVMYGSDCQIGSLMAVRLKDGERLWETFEATSQTDRRASHGTAYLVKHETRFFIFTETGDLVLANLTPKAYTEISRFHVLEPTNDCFGRAVVWSHPAFAERSVFARNDQELVCVDLAAKRYSR